MITFCRRATTSRAILALERDPANLLQGLRALHAAQGAVDMGLDLAMLGEMIGALQEIERECFARKVAVLRDMAAPLTGNLPTVRVAA